MDFNLSNPYGILLLFLDRCSLITDHCPLSSGTLALQPSAMLFKALSAAVYGIDANLIEVEVDYSGAVMDQDHFHTVGLPDAAVRESRDRVRAAIKNSGYTIPPPSSPSTLLPPTSRKKAPASICPSLSAFSEPTALCGPPTSAAFSWSASLASTAASAPSPACCPWPSWPAKRELPT
jgi:hypothetical protein